MWVYLGSSAESLNGNNEFLLIKNYTIYNMLQLLGHTVKEADINNSLFDYLL